ncbi:MAG: glycoside hydrolase family 31 protein [Myxococcales bacterium]|nr:glycoside hydrolase family 31 protein [Myxococcales bacterium]
MRSSAPAPTSEVDAPRPGVVTTARALASALLLSAGAACQGGGVEASASETAATSETTTTAATGTTAGTDSDANTGTDTNTDTDTGTGTDTDGDGVGGPITVDWEPEALALVLARGGVPLLRFPTDGFQLGVVAALGDSTYDPFDTAPESWEVVVGAEPLTQPEAAVAVRLLFSGGARADLVVTEEATGRFAAELTPTAGDGAIAYLRLRPEVSASEGFYGLGEHFDRPEHRGAVRALQLEADFSIESQNNEAHVPVPLLVGTRGWGLFVESPYASTFDVAAAADDRVEATIGAGAAATDGLRFHLLGADHPLDITRLYYDITGDPVLPAPWALGPWVWRDENDDQAQVEADLQAMRDLDLPTSAIWIDRPYASGVNSFDFEPARFADPKAMIGLAHDLGFRVALWHTPYVDPDDPATADLADGAEALGYFPPTTSLLTSKWGPPLDLTNPEAYTWWQELLGKGYASLGVEGYKLDYAEDVTVGILGARTPWEFADGSTERTMHKLYSRLYHRVYAETLPPEGSFLLCRAATFGGQRYASVIWPGDLEASMRRHREQADGYVSVGGLPAALSAGLSLGPSGFPFFASDTGGYRHSPPNRETFTRWFEHTALTPVMQIGTSTNDVAWEPTPDNGFDAEMLGWYREYTRLHIRLFPYLWTHAERLAIDGRPLMRALGLAYPELGVHPPDIYLLGDDLLVAPVISAGATSREVTFPPGSWVDWFSGQVFAGEQTAVVDAPLDKLPLYLRAGGVVPLLRPTIDTLSPVADPATIDSYAADPGLLYPVTTPGPAGAFELFDGAFIEQEATAEVINLALAPGDTFEQGAVFTVIAAGDPPLAVHDNGDALAEVADLAALGDADAGWLHLPERGGSLYIKVGPGGHAIAVDR